MCVDGCVVVACAQCAGKGCGVSAQWECVCEYRQKSHMDQKAKKACTIPICLARPENFALQNPMISITLDMECSFPLEFHHCVSWHAFFFFFRGFVTHTTKVRRSLAQKKNPRRKRLPTEEMWAAGLAIKHMRHRHIAASRSHIK